MTKFGQNPIVPPFVAGNALAKKMTSKIGKLAKDRSGSAALEYALVSGGIGAGIVGSLSSVGNMITEVLRALNIVLCQQLHAFCLV